MTMPDALQKRLDRKPRVVHDGALKFDRTWQEVVKDVTGVKLTPRRYWYATPELGDNLSAALHGEGVTLDTRLVVFRRDAASSPEIGWCVCAYGDNEGVYLLTEPQFEKVIEAFGGSVVAREEKTWQELIAPYADGLIERDGIDGPFLYEAVASFRDAPTSEQERKTEIILSYEDGRLVCHATHCDASETQFWCAKIAPEKMPELFLALGHEIPSWALAIAQAADKTREPSWKIECLPTAETHSYGVGLSFTHEGISYELKQLAVRSEEEVYAAWFVTRPGERFAIRLDAGHENELLSRLGVEFTPPSMRIENKHDLPFPVDKSAPIRDGSAEDERIALLDERYHCDFVAGGKKYVVSFAPSYDLDRNNPPAEWRWFLSEIGSKEYRVFGAYEFLHVLRGAGIDAQSFPPSLKPVPIPTVETQPAVKPIEAPPQGIVNAPRKPSVKPKKESSRMKNAMAAAKAALPLASAYTAAQAAKEPLIAAINKTLKGNPFRGMVVDAIKSDYGTGALCVTIGLTLPLMSGHLPANLQSTASKASDAFITRGTQAVAEKMGDLVLKPLIAAVRVFADAEAEGSAAMLDDGHKVRVGGFAAAASEEEPVERSAGRSAANRRSGG